MAKRGSYVDWNRDEVCEVLKPFFMVGCSVRKACLAAGIPPETFYTWMKNDTTFRAKIKSWQAYPNIMARANWVDAIVNGDVEKSMQWLERKEKDEFSTRQQVEEVEPGQSEDEIKDELLSMIRSKKNAKKQPAKSRSRKSTPRKRGV